MRLPAISACGNLAGQPVGGRATRLLLGVRGCRVVVASLRRGLRLHGDVEESTREEDGQAVFNCRIMRPDAAVAEARLTVFQPGDAWSVLEGQVS